MQKSLTGIVAQKPHTAQSEERSLHPSLYQFSLVEPPHPQAEQPLRIERLPNALQWWDEERHWLVHDASGLQVPGSWSLAEAKLIQDLSKEWNWSVDSNRRVACGVQLMALAEAVCQRSAKGGEA